MGRHAALADGPSDHEGDPPGLPVRESARNLPLPRLVGPVLAADPLALDPFDDGADGGRALPGAPPLLDDRRVGGEVVGRGAEGDVVEAKGAAIGAAVHRRSSEGGDLLLHRARPVQLHRLPDDLDRPLHQLGVLLQLVVVALVGELHEVAIPSGSSWINRFAAASHWSSRRSIPMARRPSDFATTSPVPLPMNGSSTTDPGAAEYRISGSITPIGFWVGLTARPCSDRTWKTLRMRRGPPSSDVYADSPISPVCGGRCLRRTCRSVASFVTWGSLKTPPHAPAYHCTANS